MIRFEADDFGDPGYRFKFYAGVQDRIEGWLFMPTREGDTRASLSIPKLNWSIKQQKNTTLEESKQTITRLIEKLLKIPLVKPPRYLTSHPFCSFGQLKSIHGTDGVELGIVAMATCIVRTSRSFGITNKPEVWPKSWCAKKRTLYVPTNQLLPVTESAIAMLMNG
jgi:hypothetical protein